ncbi:MAG: hypothetical protein ACFB0B_01585 [Thermonemataceae bacterium]
MTIEKDRVILQGETISIIFHEEAAYIEVVFQGITHSQEYRVALDVALKLAKGYEITQWLFDQREMNVHPVDLQWAEKVWVPRSYELLGKAQRQAYVVSQEVFEQFSAQIDQHHKEPEIAIFRETEPAYAWIEL